MCAEADCHWPIDHQFGLTYANYYVVQRSVLQAMPVEWQRRAVELVQELDATFDLAQVPSDFMVKARVDGRFITDPFANYRYPLEIPRRGK